MTGWLVRSIGALVIFSSVGAVGGSINYLNNKKGGIEVLDIKEPEIKLQTQETKPKKITLQTTRTETTTVQLPKGLKKCNWLDANGFHRMKNKSENACTTFAKNQLKVEFSTENKDT